MAERINIDGEGRPPKEEATPKTTSRARTRSTRERTSAQETPAAPKRRIGQDKKTQEAISGVYTMIGGVVTTAGMVREDNGIAGTGQEIINHADTIAEAWMDLADQNPKVKKALQRFTEGSAAATLVALHVSVSMPLLIDRNVLPNPLASMFSQNGNGGSHD